MKYKNIIITILFISVGFFSCTKNDKEVVTEIIWDTWGKVNRFKVANIEFPGNSGETKYGFFRTMFFKLNEDNNRVYANHGDTFVAIVEFADTIRAEVLLSYGNATQPGNRFVGDQLKTLSKNKLRSAFITREKIVENMVKKEIL